MIDLRQLRENPDLVRDAQRARRRDAGVVDSVLVDDPDAVSVVETRDEDGTVIELHVAEDDMGKVIGRNGSVAKALRTLLKVSAARQGGSVTLEIL